MIDPRTGEEVPFPDGDLQPVPKANRVQWNKITRGQYIKQWYDAGYSTPAGGWEPYDIHHILPREYGGTNDFWNLVPLPRDLHQLVVTPWWNLFEP
ncbi:MAG TPA: HNH endonuclease signature motif containing protein [Ktedonobacteraceae bacterium]|nr:HNH endonuclease signature motif containing protein [Ktedonobacteraceae bacterium]